MRAVLSAVCVLFSAAVCSAAGPFDGKWAATVVRPAPAGNQVISITLKTDDAAKVTGSLAIQRGPESPIEWGMVKGDLIAFKVRMPFQESTQIFVYLGRITSDQIAFGRRPEDLTLGRLVEFTAARSK